MSDLEWPNFFVDLIAEQSEARSKVALSIFDSPESVQAEPPKEEKPPEPPPPEPPPAEVPAPDGNAGKWVEFLELFYEGGKKKVKNPNPDTKDQYPEVQLSTALKDHVFAAKVRKEFQAWLQQGVEAEEPEPPKITELPEGAKVSTNKDLEVGDQVWYGGSPKVVAEFEPDPDKFGVRVKFEGEGEWVSQLDFDRPAIGGIGYGSSFFVSKKKDKDDEKKSPLSALKPGDTFYEIGHEDKSLTVEKYSEVKGKPALLAEDGYFFEDEIAMEEGKVKKTKPKPKKLDVGAKLDSIDDIVPGIFFGNAWGTIGKITSMLPDGGFRYRQFDNITGKWKGTQKITKEKAEAYFSGQHFTVVEDPASQVPEGGKVTGGEDVSAGDTVWMEGKPHQIKKVEDSKHGNKFLLDNGEWVHMHDVDKPDLPGAHSYLYHKEGELRPVYETGEKVYTPTGVEVKVITSKKHPGGFMQVQIEMPDGSLKWVDEDGLSKTKEKKKEKEKEKEKADVGDVVQSSSQLSKDDWILIPDPDGFNEEYLGKIIEVVGPDDPRGPGVMLQDYSPKSAKFIGKPWFLADDKLTGVETTKTKPMKVKKGLTGKEVTDPNKLKQWDVLRIHEYNGGKVYTAQVIKNDDGWIVYNIINPKTGQVKDTRTVSPKTFEEELQVSRLPKSKVPKTLQKEPKKEGEPVDPFSLIMELHAEEELAKAKSKGKPKKPKKVDKGKWKLETHEVDWDAIQTGDMVHTKEYGPQRVVGRTATGIRLESGVVLPKSNLEKTKGKFKVSRGDKPQKVKAPEPPERPSGKLVASPDQVQEGDVIEYEHNGTAYRGEVVSWDTPGEKFRVRIIYPPAYVAKYEKYDETTGEKTFKTPSFDQAKIDKRKPRILTKEEMKGYDAQVKEYTKKLKEIDEQYAQDVAEYEAAMAGKEETHTGALQHLSPPSSWAHGSSIARDADRFFEQYKELIGDKVKDIVKDMSSGKSYWHGNATQWNDMTEGERKLAQSGHIAADEFKKLLTDDEWEAWQGALSSWQGSSGATTAHKLMGGLENLGVEGGPKYFEAANVQHHREEGRKNEALHRAISKAMAYSQLVYDALGVDHVTLYRGTKTKPVQGAAQGKKITTTTARELASFSIDPQVAYNFAGAEKRVVRYKVPVSRLFVSPVTYASLSSAKPPYSENEYVVAGQDGMEGKVMPHSMSDFSSEKMKLASYERRPLFGEVFDDDVLVIEFEPEDDDWLRSPVKDTWWPQHCHAQDWLIEEQAPRVAAVRILRFASVNVGFRRELFAQIRKIPKRATTIFDSPSERVAVSIFDAPSTSPAQQESPKQPSGGADFDEWFGKRYEGGKKKVPNPNPKTKDKYPEVAASTAMKDKAFAAKVYAEYQQETAQQEAPGSVSKGPDETESKAKKPEKPADLTKPSDLKIGDKIRYTFKGKEMIGEVVSADEDDFKALVYNPKTGKQVRFKPVSFDAEKMKERKVERADDWHRPPPPKVKPGVTLVVPDPDLEGHEIEVADVYQDEDDGKWVIKDTAGAEWNWGKGFKVVPPKPKPKSPQSTLVDVLDVKLDMNKGDEEAQSGWHELLDKVQKGAPLSGSDVADIQEVAWEVYEDQPELVEAVQKALSDLKTQAKVDETGGGAKTEAPKSQEVLDIDSDEFKQVGPQTGSNPGGLYQAENGDRYYVKTPKSEDRARNEILAGKLYELAGIGVPDLSPATRDGQFSVASKIIPGLKQNSSALRKGNVPGVLEGIAVDAWLGNWDVVGLDYDNLLVDEEGRGRRVDTGGALRYRAMGAPKGDAFGDEVTELDTFTDPDRKSGSVFHHATPQQIVDSIDRVLEIPESKIKKLVDQWGPKGAEKDKLYKTLLARRESLKKQRERYAEKIQAKKTAARVLRLALARPQLRKALLDAAR
jgi:hypothetical protein